MIEPVKPLHFDKQKKRAIFCKVLVFCILLALMFVSTFYFDFPYSYEYITIKWLIIFSITWGLDFILYDKECRNYSKAKREYEHYALTLKYSNNRKSVNENIKNYKNRKRIW
jgi:hypothetical protein